jgi:hypothetical protein
VARTVTGDRACRNAPAGTRLMPGFIHPIPKTTTHEAVAVVGIGW